MREQTYTKKTYTAVYSICPNLRFGTGRLISPSMIIAIVLSTIDADKKSVGL